jgi:uncharacterized protein (TIGR02001 family)
MFDFKFLTILATETYFGAKNMKALLIFVSVICLLFNTRPVFAGWSATATLASDYLFNGVSQTGKDPALQGSIDWWNDAGLYAGSWASNVDFGDDTNLELDLYVGYAKSLANEQTLDFGIAQYTYHGAGYSSDGNYAEAYVKWNFSGTDLNFWYSWDYFGTGAGHYIVMLNHTFTINDNLSIVAGIDRSSSLDDEKFEWEAGDKDYIHWQLMSNFSYHGFDFGVGVHGTDLDTYGETRLLATVSRTFEF